MKISHVIFSLCEYIEKMNKDKLVALDVSYYVKYGYKTDQRIEKRYPLTDSLVVAIRNNDEKQIIKILSGNVDKITLEIGIAYAQRNHKDRFVNLIMVKKLVDKFFIGCTMMEFWHMVIVILLKVKFLHNLSRLLIFGRL